MKSVCSCFRLFPWFPDRPRRGILGACLLLFAGACHAEEALYSTSFEDAKQGPLTGWVDGEAVWTSQGAEIQSGIKRSGKQALRIQGGDSRSLTLSLDGGLRNARGIEFYAERWTRKPPFKLTIEVRIDETWQAFKDLSDTVQTGKNISQRVALKFPDGKQVTGIRMSCDSPPNSGFLMDDFKLLADSPAETSVKVASVPIKAQHDTAALFVSGSKIGNEVCHTFRIPALITAKNGDLIALADARYKNGADLIHVRDIDIVMRRSRDHGKTWDPIQKIAAFGNGKPASDASLVVHQQTGEIFCFYNYMDQDKSKKEFRLYVQKSSDHGKSWSRALDITDSLVQPGWGKLDFKFITSGRGCSTRDGKILHTLVHLKYGVFVIVSEDRGRTWKTLPTPVNPADESKIIELADGSWMINSRVNGSGARWVHRSSDQGKTWQSEKDMQLIDPSCNGAIVRYSSTADGASRNRLLFSNANSAAGRKNLTVKISYDEGRTWSEGKVIDPGASAYSDMTVLADGSIGILYEPAHQEVRFTRITLEDLTDGADQSEVAKIRR